jgi:hypothetical protein
MDISFVDIMVDGIKAMTDGFTYVSFCPPEVTSE